MTYICHQGQRQNGQARSGTPMRILRTTWTSPASSPSPPPLTHGWFSLGPAPPPATPPPPAPPPVTKPNPLSFSPGPCMAPMTTLRTFWAPKGELAMSSLVLGSFSFFSAVGEMASQLLKDHLLSLWWMCVHCEMCVCCVWVLNFKGCVCLLCMGVELQGVCMFAVCLLWVVAVWVYVCWVGGGDTCVGECTLFMWLLCGCMFAGHGDGGLLVWVNVHCVCRCTCLLCSYGWLLCWCMFGGGGGACLHGRWTSKGCTCLLCGYRWLCGCMFTGGRGGGGVYLCGYWTWMYLFTVWL